MKPVRIGMLKAMPQKWEADANWEAFEEQFALHAKDLDVFVTPECFLDGYAVTEDDWTPERFAQVAQEVPGGERIQQVVAMAQRENTAIVFGFTELRGGRFYNAALVVARTGEIKGIYYKTHLQRHDLRFVRGDDLPVFDLDFGRIGVVICADRRWPESIRTLRLKGAGVCLMPTYGMWHLDNEWWMRTRSYENQMFVCFTHPKVALITNPQGNVDAKLQSSAPDVLVHTIDLEAVRDDNHLADRRPDLYGIVADVEHPSRQEAYEAPGLGGGAGVRG